MLDETLLDYSLFDSEVDYKRAATCGRIFTISSAAKQFAGKTQIPMSSP